MTTLLRIATWRKRHRSWPPWRWVDARLATGEVYEKLVAHGQHLVQRHAYPLNHANDCSATCAFTPLRRRFNLRTSSGLHGHLLECPVRVHLVNAPVLHVLEGGKPLGRDIERAAPVVHDGVDIGGSSARLSRRCDPPSPSASSCASRGGLVSSVRFFGFTHRCFQRSFFLWRRRCCLCSTVLSVATFSCPSPTSTVISSERGDGNTASW